MILPRLRFFNFLFEVRRPRVRDEQPHQQGDRDRKQSVVEETDWDETKNRYELRQNQMS